MSDKEIQDSLGLSIPSYRFLTPGSGFPILVSGTWIPDSNRYRDSGFLELYSRYYRKPGFQIPQAKISGTPEFGFLYVGGKKFPAYCHNRLLMKLSIRRILICIVIIITICIIPGLRQLIPLNREKSSSQPLSAL